MEVILLERVPNLGRLGEVVKVKPGYARNYLLPQKKALRATKENMAYFERQKAVLEQTNAERRQGAEAQAGKIDGASVVIVRQAAETGQLYGSVSTRDIADAVSALGTTNIDRQHVVLNQAIKTLGLFKIPVSLHPEVTVTVTVNVARSEEEAKTQAERGEALIGRPEEEEAPDAEAAPEAAPAA
ncbi:MAG TPA: 50S ribosomal protein L9 [Alphaproteobacteria bacterium]|nr:50S ribosomal protein L9 [Alphaproteobacteria bacterium]